MTYLLPTQVVAGVLAFLPKKLLSSEKRDYHPVFYKMRQKGLSILRDFRFDIRGTFPYSETLEQATSNLLASKVIWFTGPNLDKYEMGDVLMRYFENSVKPGLNEKQIKEMQQVAEALKKFCR